MKFAILAPGNIAHKMAQAVTGIKQWDNQKLVERMGLAEGENIEQIELYAVASRELTRAQEFADIWGFEKAYGSYKEMLEDEAVEFVYVASPHSHHYEHVKMCLEHGKHVLVEKAFTVNAMQAEELITLAREKHLLLVEAMWTRFLPSRKLIQDALVEGVIGEPQSLMANLGYPMTQKERLQNPELAGGALLDVGVYPINFAMMVFDGNIEKMHTSAVMSPKGIDWSNSVTLNFEGGKLAVLHSTMLSPTDRLGVIYGEHGYMEIQNINNCEEIRILNAEHELVERRMVPDQINGYEYEILSCMKAIREGKIECEEMPHHETLRVMRLLDEIRSAWGMKYPCEER